MRVRLKLFFEWGIIFPDELYDVSDSGNRSISYARKDDLMQKISEVYPQLASTDNKGVAIEETTPSMRADHRFQKPAQM